MSKTGVAARLRPQPRASATKASICIALTIATGIASVPAHAQWFTQDNAAISKAAAEYSAQARRWIETIQQYKNTIAHYGKEVAHWKAQIDQWEQQLVKLKALDIEIFSLENKFAPVADDYGVKEECPGSSGGLAADITTALQSFIPVMDGDVVKQQKDLCRLVVRSKNAKYNRTVKYLGFIAQATRDFEAIQTTRFNSVDKSPANLQSVATDTARFASNLSEARAAWETDLKQHDAQIHMLRQMQAILSRRAMNGQPSPLGTLVNTAAMRAAFKL
jgi:hypothetical protein